MFLTFTKNVACLTNSVKPFKNVCKLFFCSPSIYLANCMSPFKTFINVFTTTSRIFQFVAIWARTFKCSRCVDTFSIAFTVIQNLEIHSEIHGKNSWYVCYNKSLWTINLYTLHNFWTRRHFLSWATKHFFFVLIDQLWQFIFLALQKIRS